MDFSLLGPVEIALLVGGLVVASIVAGIVAGLLGVGGGIVIVPVLFWLFTLTNFPRRTRHAYGRGHLAGDDHRDVDSVDAGAS